MAEQDETNRCETGEFTINFYDGYGGKLRLMKDKCNTLTGSIAIGHAKVQADGDLRTAKSFTIDRRLYNSLDDNSLLG